MQPHLSIIQVRLLWSSSVRVILISGESRLLLDDTVQFGQLNLNRICHMNVGALYIRFGEEVGKFMRKSWGGARWERYDGFSIRKKLDARDDYRWSDCTGCGFLGR